jgi:aspartate 4-decarboxylase
VAQENVFDEMIKAHPEDIQQTLENRYKAMTPTPRDIKFIDRIVADSRDVALNHTAGCRCRSRS